MPLNSEIIIADTSCLILLTKIGELTILQGFQCPVYITPTIAREFKDNLPVWIDVVSPAHGRYQEILTFELDDGEASAIALALETEDSVLLIDDLKGRKVAEKLNLRYSGTFGLFLRAKQEGIIERVKPILEKVSATNFRFSQKLFEELMKQAGE